VAGQDGGHRPLSVGKFAVTFKLYSFRIGDHVQLFTSVEVKGQFNSFFQDGTGLDFYSLEVSRFTIDERYLEDDLFETLFFGRSQSECAFHHPFQRGGGCQLGVLLQVGKLVIENELFDGVIEGQFAGSALDGYPYEGTFVCLNFDLDQN
jgi:hypothetical protein